MTCHISKVQAGDGQIVFGEENQAVLLVMYGQYDSQISMFCLFQGTTLMCRCGEDHAYTMLSICRNTFDHHWESYQYTNSKSVWCFTCPFFCLFGLCPAKLSACKIQTFLFGHCCGSRCETLLPGRGITVIELRSINRQTCGMHNKTQLILLMEEILHHLRCTKLFPTPLNNGFHLPTSTGAGFLPSTHNSWSAQRK